MSTNDDSIKQTGLRRAVAQIRRHVSGRQTAALGALLIVCACFARWDGFTLLAWRQARASGVVRWQAETPTNATDAPRIALTFDDGPDPRYTPAVLAILARYHVHATFFVEGRFVRAHPDLARRIVAQGHVLGNHTDTHPYLNRLDAPAVRAEINACDRTLQDTLGLHTYLFRPPRGLWNAAIYGETARRGDHLVLWTVALEHHDAPASRAMTERALRLLNNGGILLMHDGGSAPRDTTVAALPLLLDGLKARGYRCVTVPELLHIPGNVKAKQVLRQP